MAGGEAVPSAYRPGHVPARRSGAQFCFTGRPFRYEKWFSGRPTAPLDLGWRTGSGAGCLAARPILALGRALASAPRIDLGRRGGPGSPRRPSTAWSRRSPGATGAHAWYRPCSFWRRLECASGSAARGRLRERGTSRRGGAGAGARARRSFASETARPEAAASDAIYLFIASVGASVSGGSGCASALRRRGSGLRPEERWRGRLNAPPHPRNTWQDRSPWPF